MKRVIVIFASATIMVWLVSCGGGSYGNDTSCKITATVAPPSASADHTLPPPANQAQFSTTSTVTGNCPLVADQLGSWSTSDPANTTVSNQAPTQGLATCLHATSTLVTISNSGTVRTHTFTPATLVCK